MRTQPVLPGLALEVPRAVLGSGMPGAGISPALSPVLPRHAPERVYGAPAQLTAEMSSCLVLHKEHISQESIIS